MRACGRETVLSGERSKSTVMPGLGRPITAVASARSKVVAFPW
jgi:hypothetical protein